MPTPKGENIYSDPGWGAKRKIIFTQEMKSVIIYWIIGEYPMFLIFKDAKNFLSISKHVIE
jgi:hypothetical protein